MASKLNLDDLATLPRNPVHDLVELLNARLDLEDGDFDLEPEEDFGIDDVPHDRDEGMLPPIYGIDQTRDLSTSRLPTAPTLSGRGSDDRS